MTPAGSHLVLASRSPQRAAILAALGVRFVVRPSRLAEIEEGHAEQVASANALGKALAVERAPGELVLGADTVVEFGGRLWGKPADDAQARETLSALSAKTHVVTSAVSLLDGDASPRVAVCATRVTLRPLDEATIEWYLASGEWRERAGGYAIQGAGCALVASIEGDWTNVVGLPVGTLLTLAPKLLQQRVRRSDPAELQR